MGAACRAKALEIASELTRAGIRVLTHCGEGSLKNQFKKADKSGSSLAIVIGESELEMSVASLKTLRRKENAVNQGQAGQNNQVEVPFNQLLDAVTNAL